MKTTADFFEYIKSNDFGKGPISAWDKKHLKVIEETLNDEEEVYMLFIGLHNYISALKHNNNYAYALTSDRLIMGQKKMIGENSISVYLNQLNDVKFSSGMLWGVITFDTFSEVVNVAVDKKTGKRIFSELQKALSKTRNINTNDKVAEKESATDQLLKLKSLLDADLLTKEEFDNEKKKLLSQ